MNIDSNQNHPQGKPELQGSNNRIITVNLAERSYPIIIGQDLFSPELICSYITAKQVCIVTNPAVADYYLSDLEACLKKAGFDYHVVTIPDGEQHKTLGSFEKILQSLIQHKHHRSTTLIALGGGVIGDLTGFAAACYQRGVNFIQIPTTLLAQVDASVGGKTAVNHAQAKNMIGAFHQPSLVLIDTNVLTSLPNREFNAGLAEVIKYGLIADSDFFDCLEQNLDLILQRDPIALSKIISRSCELKAEIVAEDEHEKGKRALLNFGHTFGHAIEAVTDYKIYLHGEAVAIGMLMACHLSHKLGYIENSVASRLGKMLVKIGLPLTVSHPSCSAGAILNAMSLDKKNTSQTPTLILLKQLGCAEVFKTIELDVIRSVLALG